MPFLQAGPFHTSGGPKWDSAIGLQLAFPPCAIRTLPPCHFCPFRLGPRKIPHGADQTEAKLHGGGRKPSSWPTISIIADARETDPCRGPHDFVAVAPQWHEIDTVSEYGFLIVKKYSDKCRAIVESHVYQSRDFK